MSVLYVLYNGIELGEREVQKIVFADSSHGAFILVEIERSKQLEDNRSGDKCCKENKEGGGMGTGRDGNE